MNFAHKTISTLLFMMLSFLTVFSHHFSIVAEAGDDYPPTFHDSVELHGNAWSSTVGWISFNCDNDGTCSDVDYKVEMNPDYSLTGYAWSSNIGWIQFGGLLGCPSGSCAARVSADRTELLGWARACSATVGGNCAGALHPDGGGWDGWISLNSSNTGGANNYRVTMGIDNFDGFAWGGDVVGWVNFNPLLGRVTIDPPCSSTSFPECNADNSGIVTYNEWCIAVETICPGTDQCVPGFPPVCEDVSATSTPGPLTGALTASQLFVLSGNTVELFWDMSASTASECRVLQGRNPIANSLTGPATSNPLYGRITFYLECRYDVTTPWIELDYVSVGVIPQTVES